MGGCGGADRRAGVPQRQLVPLAVPRLQVIVHVPVPLQVRRAYPRRSHLGVGLGLLRHALLLPEHLERGYRRQGRFLRRQEEMRRRLVVVVGPRRQLGREVPRFSGRRERVRPLPLLRDVLRGPLRRFLVRAAARRRLDRLLFGRPVAPALGAAGERPLAVDGGVLDDVRLDAGAAVASLHAVGQSRGLRFRPVLGYCQVFAAVADLGGRRDDVRHDLLRGQLDRGGDLLDGRKHCHAGQELLQVLVLI
jgi:hypothetical protein